MSNIQEIKISKNQLNILNKRWEIFINNEKSWISIIADVVKSNPRIGYIENYYEIDDIKINEDIFQEEKYDYSIVDVDDEINNLIMFIQESKSDSQSELMKEDLKQLINCDEGYIFSSINTNEYIDSTFGNHYNSHCEAILLLNKGK